MLMQVAMFIQNSLPSQYTICAIVVEAVLRLVKTDKPLSIAHGIAQGLNYVAIIAIGVANFLDKVFPQNLNPPKV